MTERSSLPWIAVGVGAAAVALVTLASMFVPSGPASFSGPTIDDLVAVVGDVRLTTARPDGGFAHGEPGHPAETATRTRLEAMATDMRLALGREPDPQALHALGVAWFLLGREDDAQGALEAALEAAPGDAGVLSDLGAIDVERGLGRGDERLLRRGLDRSLTALTADPDRAAPAFNAALARTALQPDSAADAWTRALATETDPDWAAEARRRAAASGVAP